MEKPSSPNRPAMRAMVSTSGNAMVFRSTLPDNADYDVGAVTRVSATNLNYSPEIVQWGKLNDLPQYREILIGGNNIVPQLIRRKRDIICGQGWKKYKVRYETPEGAQSKRIVDEISMTPEQETFFKKFKKVARTVTGELVKHDIAFLEVVMQANGVLKALNPIKTKYMRAGRRVNGEIKTWYYSNAWTVAEQNILLSGSRVVQEMPVYDPSKKQLRFVIVLQDDIFDDGYYPIPSWWGSRYWVELANAIPLFHLHNLKNMSAPRWLLVVPHDYFRDYEKWNAANTDQERETLLNDEKGREKAFVDDFNDLVTGMENTGRTLTVQTVTEEMYGKITEKRIHVEPLVIDLRDDAMLKLYEASNTANISAQGLHPTLANIETQGKLSSGTEMRNAYLLWLIIGAPTYRDQLYEMVSILAELQGWPADEYFDIRDAELTTLADNPAGVREAQTPIAT